MILPEAWNQIREIIAERFINYEVFSNLNPGNVEIFPERQEIVFHCVEDRSSGNRRTLFEMKLPWVISELKLHGCRDIPNSYMTQQIHRGIEQVIWKIGDEKGFERMMVAFLEIARERAAPHPAISPSDKEEPLMADEIATARRIIAEVFGKIGEFKKHGMDEEGVEINPERQTLVLSLPMENNLIMHARIRAAINKGMEELLGAQEAAKLHPLTRFMARDLNGNDLGIAASRKPNIGSRHLELTFTKDFAAFIRAVAAYAGRQVGHDAQDVQEKEALANGPWSELFTDNGDNPAFGALRDFP